VLAPVYLKCAVEYEGGFAHYRAKSHTGDAAEGGQDGRSPGSVLAKEVLVSNSAFFIRVLSFSFISVSSAYLYIPLTNKLHGLLKHEAHRYPKRDARRRLL